MTDGRLSRLGWTLTREGARGCRVVADEWPMTLSASWVPACVQARHHFSPQNLSAAVCFCYSGRQHQFFDNVGRDIQATSLPTARTHRRRRLAPACLARPGGAPFVPRSQRTQLCMSFFMLCNLHASWIPLRWRSIVQSQTHPPLRAKDCGYLKDDFELSDAATVFVTL